MNIDKKVYCTVNDEPEAMELRRLFCVAAAGCYNYDYNPLVETRFNKLFDVLTQKAFEAGREYERGL